MTEQPPSDWPEVTVGGPERPHPVDHGIDDDLMVARPREVVAYGTVNGIPWTIQAFVTAPGPKAKWWDHGPVGPELEFFLGKDGWFGGGGVSTWLDEGNDFTASLHFFGRFPETVSWVGLASNRTDHLEVRLDDGRTRRADLHEEPEGFPRFFWFFPPRRAAGVVVAVDANGNELQRESLMDIEVSPTSNAGTAIGGLGWPAGRPPPVWPPDPREYGPGEGPRWDEDFYLHVATFPLFVLPPESWEGFALLGGGGSSGPPRNVTEVRFAYLDAIPTPTRGLGVHNRHPDEARRRARTRRPARQEDIGIWFAGSSFEQDEMDLLGRFLPQEQVRRMHLEARHDIGPRRCLGGVEIGLAGHRVPAERWEYMEHPRLRVVRAALPDVELTVLGWDLTDRDLLGYASRLERLELGTDLFGRMSQAQAASDAAFGADHDRRHLEDG